MILTPWSLYETYGDTRILEDYYPGMQSYLAYLTSKSQGNLLDYGINDWITPDPTVPTGVIATYAYYRSAATMSRVAAVLGNMDDAAGYTGLAQQIAGAFNDAFLDPVTHVYAGGHQAADAVALDMNIVPADLQQTVLDHLIADIRAKGNHVNVGIVTLGALFRSLSAAGRDDVIFDVATQTTNPSYGYQIMQGATSLTEEWDGPTKGGSQNHMMLGAIDEWFTAALAGIRQATGSVGYTSLEIKPAVVGNLTHVAGSYCTPNGLVESEWTMQPGGQVAFTITIPANTQASIYLPDQTAYEVGPGTFQFTVPAPASEPRASASGLWSPWSTINAPMNRPTTWPRAAAQSAQTVAMACSTAQ
jgi:alpha-L-rhamnosidase